MTTTKHMLTNASLFFLRKDESGMTRMVCAEPPKEEDEPEDLRMMDFD